MNLLQYIYFFNLITFSVAILISSSRINKKPYPEMFWKNIDKIELCAFRVFKLQLMCDNPLK